jgi:hypothetical protein
VQTPSVIVPIEKTSAIVKAAESKPVQNSVPDIVRSADPLLGEISQNNQLTVAPDPVLHEHDVAQKIVSGSASTPLNLDTRNIAKNLNVEAPILEGTTPKSNDSAYAKFEQKAIQASRAHEGVRYEKKFLFDGRPVTKVVTPYGTYCVRHRKPGESPELTPAIVPVHCGNL